MSGEKTVADELRLWCKRRINIGGCWVSQIVLDQWPDLIEAALAEKDSEIERLKAAMCIYAREQFDAIDFESDADCVAWFLDYAKDVEGGA